MKNAKTFLITSSALVMAGVFYVSAASVQAASLNSCMAGGLTEAECACEAALEKGTRQALRIYQRHYRGEDTACNATASTMVITDPGDHNEPASRASGGDRPGGDRQNNVQ
jgi:hypothetical protein